jgi:hypothetical protein
MLILLSVGPALYPQEGILGVKIHYDIHRMGKPRLHLPKPDMRKVLMRKPVNFLCDALPLQVA